MATAARSLPTTTRNIGPACEDQSLISLERLKTRLACLMGNRPTDRHRVQEQFAQTVEEADEEARREGESWAPQTNLVL